MKKSLIYLSAALFFFAFAVSAPGCKKKDPLPSVRILELSGDLAFGTVTVGQNVPSKTLTIKNTGSSPLTVIGLDLPTGFSGTYSGMIPAGGSQPVSIGFAPASAGPYGNVLTVNANQTGGNKTIPISGIGQTTPLPNEDISTGLMLYLPFNGNAQDESGNNRHGSVNGAVLAADRKGNAGKAYSFDGVNDDIAINQAFVSYTSLTVSAWVLVSATTTDFQAIVSSNSTEFFHFQMHTAGNVVVYPTSQAAVLFPIIPQTPAGQWRHLVMCASPGNSRIYENGVLISSSNVSYSSITSTNLLKVGSGHANGRFFKGQLDDIRIYNRALTAGQVDALYRL